MIRNLRGSVGHVGLDHLVVEVGGVGLQAFTTPATAAGASEGATILLFTTLVVREESLTLYGFAEQDERELFERVQTVSGVGPRLALAMLAVHQPDELRRAITGGDLVALTRVPGIGRKGAERIVLELRDKVAPPAAPMSAVPGTPSDAAPDSWKAQVQEALVGLGWSAKQAGDTVDAVAAEPVQTQPAAGTEVSQRLRAALRRLGRS